MTAAGPGGHPSRPFVLGPDGRPVATVPAPQDAGPPTSGPPAPTDLVGQPAKLIRIGSMVKQLLDEVRTAPLDEASRNRLRDIHAASICELEDGLSPELCAELDRLALPFDEEQTPSVAELRIAQAQLIGWLEGLFHGIQMAVLLQQMTARAQLEGLHGGTPPPQQLEFPSSGGTYL
jgi:hypothetical protein